MLTPKLETKARNFAKNAIQAARIEINAGNHHTTGETIAKVTGILETCLTIGAICQSEYHAALNYIKTGNNNPF